MPTEIEAKMKLADRGALDDRLASLGLGEPVRLFETNTYYDRPDGALRKADEGLRIRVEQRGDNPSERRVIITHKGPRQRGRLKTRSESELTVDDPEAADALLRALGFEPVLTFEKRRTRWRLDDCHIDVDSLPLLGDYVEIEGPDDDSVYAARERLGLSGAPLVTRSYIAMLTRHLAEHGDDRLRVTFTADAC